MNILQFYLAILLVCFTVGLLNYKHLNNSTKYIFYFVLLAVITESVGYYSLYMSSEKKVNTFVFYLYRPFEFLFISMFFYINFKGRLTKNLIIFLIPLVVIFYLIFGIPSKLDLISNYKLYLFSFFCFCLFSILYFKQILDTELELILNSGFWITTGILIFYSGSFFLSGFINFLAKSNLELARKVFSINHVLNIFFYSLVTYGFICQRRLARS